jgi:hypothetical protein
MYVQNVTTNNCDSLNELHTSKITVTTAHMKSSQFAILHQSLCGDVFQK